MNDHESPLDLSRFELLACLSLYDDRISFDHFAVAPPLEIELVSGAEALRRARETLERCREIGARVLFPGHPWYPASFLDLDEPPLFLSCFGQPTWQSHLCLSVVGSREPGRASLAWLDEELVKLLRTRVFATVSGGARGIDQRAHSVSLRLGLPTVVFLPSGLARPYPNEFASWIPEVVAAGGAVLSELPPDEPMSRVNFERRNRMIAAMGLLLIVAEARRRSGSMITARHARELGRTVCVLPSFPGDARTAGGVDLLFDGAQPLRDAADLMCLVNQDSMGLWNDGFSIPGAAQAPDGCH